MKRAPVLFVSHGAPTFALEPGLAGPQLAAVGQTLTNIKAVVVVSPHWETAGVEVTAATRLETIHDFYGFPEPLYDIQYPAHGHPTLAKVVVDLLRTAGLPASLHPDRGLDHGAWVPMMYLVPDGQIPIVQVSMPYGLNTQKAFEMGQALAALREQGVLIVASGAVTHNLSEFRIGLSGVLPYVPEFVAWVRKTLTSHDVDKMLHYRTLAPHAARAHPSEDHFLPLLVAMGATASDDSCRVIDGGVTYGFLSMDSYVWD